MLGCSCSPDENLQKPDEGEEDDVRRTTNKKRRTRMRRLTRKRHALAETKALQGERERMPGGWTATSISCKQQNKNNCQLMRTTAETDEMEREKEAHGDCSSLHCPSACR